MFLFALKLILFSFHLLCFILLFLFYSKFVSCCISTFLFFVCLIANIAYIYSVISDIYIYVYIHIYVCISHICCCVILHVLFFKTTVFCIVCVNKYLAPFVFCHCSSNVNITRYCCFFFFSVWSNLKTNQQSYFLALF